MKPGKHHWPIDASADALEKFMRYLQSLGYNCTQYTYPPGTCFPEHTHEVDKIDAVIQGRFEITIQGESVLLKPGDYIEVPKHTLHSARVIGDESVVSIDAVLL